MEPRPVYNASALEVVRPANVVSADEWNERREAFIRQNYCNDAPDPEASAFITICKRRGLAPEEKQIYLIPRKGKWTVQTSIDGYRLIAERTGVYAGSDEPVFVESGHNLLDGKGKAYPAKATVTVYKIVAGVRSPFTASAYWEEYNAGTDLWLKMPHVMLAKCAESQALRKAFPADLSGIYTVEEMDQAGSDDREPPRAAAQPAPAGNGDASTEMRAVHAAARDKGVTHDQLSALAVAAYGVPSMTECGALQLKGLRGVVVACTGEQFATVLEVATFADTNADREVLDQMAQQVAAGDLPEIAKRLLRATIERIGGRLRGGPPPASPSGGEPPLDEVVDASFAPVDDPAMPSLADWEARVRAAYGNPSIADGTAALESLLKEAGSDAARWVVLIKLAPSLGRARHVRAAHVQSPAAKEQTVVDAYRQRQADLESAERGGK